MWEISIAQKGTQIAHKSNINYLWMVNKQAMKELKRVLRFLMKKKD